MINKDPIFNQKLETQEIQANTSERMEDSIEKSSWVTVLPEAYIQLNSRYKSVIAFFEEWKEANIDSTNSVIWMNTSLEFWNANSDLAIAKKMHDAQIIFTNHSPNPNENIVLTQEESQKAQSLYKEVEKAIMATMSSMIYKLEEWQEYKAKSILITVGWVLREVEEMRNIVQSGTTV